MSAPQSAGEHRLLTRFRMADARATIEQHIANIVISRDVDAPPDPRAKIGDPLRLRGIPVVGVPGGKGGVIRGTNPGAFHGR